MKFLIAASVLFAILLSGGTSIARAAESAEVRIALQHPEDRGEVREIQGEMRVDVTCASGIGRATLSLPARGRWPKTLVLRLRYAPGKPYAGLEGLQVDGRTVEAPMRSRRDWLEIRLPMRGHAGAMAMRLQWVDAYR